MAGFTAFWHAPTNEFREIPDFSSCSTTIEPFSDGRLTILGNWRVDNGPALAQQLGLEPDLAAGAILAAGWSRWGPDLAKRMGGPFAIAIHDRFDKVVYCARDALGVEPMFYARSADSIAFASSPVAARKAVGLRSKPDHAMIADFLRGEMRSSANTFHMDLFRLPPGHWMLFGPHSEQQARYWSFVDVGTIAGPDDAVAKFSFLLDESVRVCGLDDNALGIMLSGGLDSSAIAGVVDHMRGETRQVQTFSMTYEGMPGWADGPYIDAMRQALDMQHHTLPSYAHDPLADMETIITALDGPCFGYGVSVSNKLLPAARSHGVTTLLHGHGGDEIVSYGTGRLNELARAGRWRDLWRESEGAAELWWQPRWRVFDRYLKHRRERRWIDRQWRRFIPKAPTDPRGSEEPRFLDRGLAEAFPLPETAALDPATRPDHTDRDLQIAALDTPLQAHALETIALTGRHYGLEVTLPFMSRELAEYSLALPSEWKMRNGYTRYILREAMRGRVPDAIVRRRDKNDFTQDFIKGLLSDTEQLRDLANPSNNALAGYVSREWLRDAWRKVEQQGENISTATARGLWQAAVLAMWLAMDRDAAIDRDYDIQESKR